MKDKKQGGYGRMGQDVRHFFDISCRGGMNLMRAVLP